MSCRGNCNHGLVEKSEVLLHDSDEIWADTDDTINVNADRERSHYKKGYVDGISQGKEQGLQDGFDKGYPLGAQLGVRVGKVLAHLKSVDSELFSRARSELNIKHVLSLKYVDSKEESPRHELVEKWEKICSEYPIK